MMGFEPIPRFSRERILSPLRLPFRHIGASRSLEFNHVMRTGENEFRGCWRASSPDLPMVRTAVTVR
jgi:hypothetical protein